MPGVGADLYEVLSRIDLPIPGMDIVVGESVGAQCEFNLGLAASGNIHLTEGLELMGRP